jgi:hypothetical protein
MSYQGSDEHKNNLAKVREIARQASVDKAAKLRETYYENPNKCAECSSSLDFYKRSYRFCSKSCAASFNNRHKEPPSEQTKQKIGLSNKGKKKPGQRTERQSYCELVMLKCKVCEKDFYRRGYTSQLTCSKTCRTKASIGMRTYQNGSRKPVWFFNPYEDKEVLLESSWEIAVAEALISANIPWTRPEPLPWKDSMGVSHLYFPDFYIPEDDVYLDPKNPYCMSRDKEKIAVISMSVMLVVGGLPIIMEYIEKKKAAS